jgi:DNA-binding SARP family transcriptional activator
MDVRRRYEDTELVHRRPRLHSRARTARGPHAKRPGHVRRWPGSSRASAPSHEPAGVATLALLGAPRVRAHGVWRELPPARWVGLLAYVARAGSWVRREALAAAFWPEHERDRAYVNVRQALQSIARSPAGDAFEREPTRVLWRGACDVTTFEGHVRSHAWRRAIAAYTGPFLDGYEEIEATPFGTWLEAERQGLEDRWRASVSALAERLLEGHRAFEALELADRLVRRDPFDEAAVRLALRAAAAHGDRTRGARAFHALRRTLADELDVEPEAATVELAADLMGAAAVR